MSDVIDIITWPFMAPIRWVSQLFSNEEKMRSSAANWIELADKVWHFRRDELRGNEADELLKHRDELRRQLKAKADAGKLKLSIEALESVLRRTGGAIYPKTSLVENVEFFLVAAIVILGIRTYFVQPFKIPTNSMWPTYYGMTPEVFTKTTDEPGKLAEVGRLLAFGASSRRLNAPVDGEVLIPIGGRQSRGLVSSLPVAGHSWLVLPATVREYTLLVGDEPVSVKVPEDFDFDWAVYDGFFRQDGQHYTSSRFRDILSYKLSHREYEIREVNGESLQCVRTGIHVRAGQRLFAFDILTGDQLFVDRISYHFIKPSVGSGFVFRTGNIPYIADRVGDQYYIKRLVGVPGDTLKVEGSTLIRNGGPITGADAFQANAQKQGNYPGYRALGLLTTGSSVQVLPHSFFAMGDNSANSEDSRYWGFVPEKDAVGRPLFIYYPFTKRWGPAR